MRLKEIVALIMLAMFASALITFLDAPTKGNLKTVLARGIPLL